METKAGAIVVAFLSLSCRVIIALPYRRLVARHLEYFDITAVKSSLSAVLVPPRLLYIASYSGRSRIQPAHMV